MPTPGAVHRLGITYGLLAYAWWGMIPLYFKAVKSVAAPEILAHRVIWSFAFSALLMLAAGGWRQAFAVLRRPVVLAMLFCASALIATNWLAFIWAVEHNRVLEASFGYFVNPLVNVLLGVVFLGERMRKPQAASVALAATGVAVLAVHLGAFPWLGLLLAFSFGFYGLVRKTAHLGALSGLTFECALLVPIAAGYLGWLAVSRGGMGPGHDLRMFGLLALAGPITALPLLWFAGAARRLRLTTLGFLQYISPTLQFLLAVAVFREPFTTTHLAAFALIWTALAVFTWDAVRRHGRVVPGTA